MAFSRREFLGTTAMAATAAALGTSLGRRAMAKDIADIRVAQIGFNSQGGGHIRASHPYIVALCDADEAVLHRMADRFKDEYGKQVDTYTDFRKLLEDKNIDAVSIATPNHTHAWIAVAAAQAGKDVYVEKPASHNIWEGRQMIEAARQNNRVMQVGTQSRSSQSLADAVEFVRSGELGEIQYAIGTCYKPRPSIGKRDEPLEIPKSVDYDLWCGPAAKEALYRPRFHYDWHWDTNTGNGDTGNQGPHQMDIARWFLGESKLAPRVISIGGRLGYDDAGDTPNTQTIFFDYAKAPLIFETRGLPRSKEAQKKWGVSMDRFRGSGVGVIVQCEKGFVLVPSYTRAEAFDRDGKSIKSWTTNHDALKAHQQNWLAAASARDASRLNAPIEEGHRSSSLCHLGGVSHALGKQASAAEIADRIKANDLFSDSFERMAAHLRANDVDIDREEGGLILGEWLEVDPETETFVKNDAANERRGRKQREGYAIPDLERGASRTAAAG